MLFDANFSPVSLRITKTLLDELGNSKSSILLSVPGRVWPGPSIYMACALGRVKEYREPQFDCRNSC